MSSWRERSDRRISFYAIHLACQQRDSSHLLLMTPRRQSDAKRVCMHKLDIFLYAVEFPAENAPKSTHGEFVIFLRVTALVATIILIAPTQLLIEWGEFGRILRVTAPAVTVIPPEEARRRISFYAIHLACQQRDSSHSLLMTPRRQSDAKRVCMRKLDIFLSVVEFTSENGLNSNSGEFAIFLRVTAPA